MRILLIEDNTFDADLISRELVKLIPECEIDIAQTVFDAKNRLRQNALYNAAIIDVNLPDGSGSELLIDIKELMLEMTMIVLSGSGDAELAVSSFRAGADDFVMKSDNYITKLAQTLIFHHENFENKIQKKNQIINVFYVEHHLADLDLTIRHFKKYAPNIHIIHVPDGLSLLKRLEKKELNCQIILLDYKLPGIDGLQITKKIKQEYKLDIPIVIITGQGNEDIVIQAMNLGVDDYVVKRENYVYRLPSLLQNVYQRRLLEKQQKELEDSERHYRLIAENADDVIFTLDLDLNYTYISPSVLKLRGYSPEELINKPIADTLSPESYSIVLSEIKNALHPDPKIQQISISHITLELELYRKDKSKIWVEINASLLKDENNIPYGILGVTRDISEKKNILIALNESHLEYKTFFEDDLTGDYVSTTDGKLINCNPAYLKILGIKSKEEALKLDLFSVFPSPNDRYLLMDKLRIESKLINYEFEMRRVDGRKIFVIANITGIFNENKELVSLRGYLIDNTARKLAADELRKISLAVEQSPASILITNTKGEIEYANPKFCSVSQYNLNEVIGQNPSIIKSGETLEEDYKNLWDTIKSGKNWQGEFLNKRKDGTLFWEYATISSIKNTEGEITHYLAVKEDITEKKRLQSIQEILVNISNAVLVSDSLEEFSHLIFIELKKIINTNNFYIALINEETQLISTPFIVDNLDKDISAYPAKNTFTGYVINKKESIFIDEKTLNEFIQKGDIKLIGPASEVWIGVPLFSKEKAIGAIVIQNYKGEKKLNKDDMKILEYVAPQISLAIERKKAVEDLKLALEKAEESDKLKTAFLNNISHEIRTPLNGILGFAPLIVQPDVEQEEKELYLDILYNSGERLINTVTDYMDISLIVSGSMQTIVKPFDLPLLLNEVFEKFKTRSLSKKNDLKLIIPESNSVFIMNSDKELILKVLNHLIDNAIKFTVDGSIEFGFNLKSGTNGFLTSATSNENNQGQIEIFVKDTGKGIEKSSHDFIFKVFRQENFEISRGHEGSGLGLSISKGIVQLLGGTIHLESEINVGTSVFITLPIKKNDFTTNPTESVSVEKKQPKRLNILIAEDDEMNLLYFETLLKDFPVNLFKAENGKKAIEICKNHAELDLVIMDIKMPEINGLEATSEIKSFRKDLPIIAITAHAMSGDEKRITDAGCDAYYSKPIGKKKFIEIINNYL